MTEIRPDLSVSRNLLEQIRQRAQDGTITKDELTELRASASSDSAGLDSNEAKLLDSLDTDVNSQNLVQENVNSFKSLVEHTEQANKVNFGELNIRSERTGMWSSITSLGGLLGRGTDNFAVRVADGEIPPTDNPAQPTSMAKRRETDVQNLNNMIGPLETELRANSPETQERLAATIGVDPKAPDAKEKIEAHRTELLSKIEAFKADPSDENFTGIYSKLTAIVSEYNRNPPTDPKSNMTGPYMTSLRASLYNLHDTNRLTKTENELVQTRGEQTPENTQAINTRTETATTEARQAATQLVENSKALISSLDALRAQGPEAFRQTMGNFTEQDLDLLKAQVKTLEESVAEGKPISQAQLSNVNAVWSSMSQISNQPAFSDAQNSDLRAEAQTRLTQAEEALKNAKPEDREAAQSAVDAAKGELESMPPAGRPLSEQARAVLRNFNQTFETSEPGSVRNAFSKIESAAKESSLTLAQLRQAKQALGSVAADPNMTPQQRASARQQLAAIDVAQNSLLAGNKIEFKDDAQRAAFDQVLSGVREFSSQPMPTASGTSSPLSNYDPFANYFNPYSSPTGGSGGYNSLYGGFSLNPYSSPSGGSGGYNSLYGGFSLNSPYMTPRPSLTSGFASQLSLGSTSGTGSTAGDMVFNSSNGAAMPALETGNLFLTPTPRISNFNFATPINTSAATYSLPRRPLGDILTAPAGAATAGTGVAGGPDPGPAGATGAAEGPEDGSADATGVAGGTDHGPAGATGPAGGPAAAPVSPETQKKLDSLQQLYNSIPSGENRARSLILAAQDELRVPGSSPDLPPGFADRVASSYQSLTERMSPETARDVMVAGLANVTRTGNTQGFQATVQQALQTENFEAQYRANTQALQNRNATTTTNRIQQLTSASTISAQNAQNRINDYGKPSAVGAPTDPNAPPPAPTDINAPENTLRRIFAGKTDSSQTNASYIATMSDADYQALDIPGQMRRIQTRLNEIPGGNARDGVASTDVTNLRMQMERLQDIQTYRTNYMENVSNANASIGRLDNQLNRLNAASPKNTAAIAAVTAQRAELVTIRDSIQQERDLTPQQITALGRARELRVTGDMIAWYSAGGVNTSTAQPAFGRIYNEYKALLDRPNPPGYSMAEMANVRQRLMDAERQGQIRRPSTDPPQYRTPILDPASITPEGHTPGGTTVQTVDARTAPTDGSLGVATAIHIADDQHQRGEIRDRVNAPDIQYGQDGVSIQHPDGTSEHLNFDQFATLITNPAYRTALGPQISDPNSMFNQVVARLTSEGTITPATLQAIETARQEIAASSVPPSQRVRPTASDNTAADTGTVTPTPTGTAAQPSDASLGPPYDLAAIANMGGGTNYMVASGTDGAPTDGTSSPDPALAAAQALTHTIDSGDYQALDGYLDEAQQASEVMGDFYQNWDTLSDQLADFNDVQNQDMSSLFNQMIAGMALNAGIPASDLNDMASEDPTLDAATQATINEANRLEAESDLAPLPSVSSNDIFDEFLSSVVNSVRGSNRDILKLIAAQLARQMVEQVIQNFYKHKREEAAKHHEDALDSMSASRNQAVQQQQQNVTVQNAGNTQAVAAVSGQAEAAAVGEAYGRQITAQADRLPSADNIHQEVRSMLQAARTGNPPMAVSPAMEEQLMDGLTRILRATETPEIDDDLAALNVFQDRIATLN